MAPVGRDITHVPELPVLAPNLRPRAAAVLLGVALLAAAAPASASGQPATAPARAPGHTAADVAFMQGMIGHHAQAVVMAAMAPTHGASPQVALFCRKIMASQRDEIDQMEEWLRERGVPAATAGEHAGHGGAHAMPMPGMLSAEQLARLDAARGAEFDRLFLTLMIQHHEGALAMVATLFASPGSGQGAEIFGFATGVDADQRAEIERMRQMLAAISPGR